jgi:hypothetical protein
LSDFGEKRGGRIGLGTGGIPYGAAAEDIIPDEKPGAEKLMQADPSSLPKPGGGGVSGALGAAGSLASLVPGGQLIGAGLGAASKIGGLFGFAEGGEVDDGSDEADNNIGLGEKPVEVKDEEGPAERNIPMEAPKIEPLKGQTLNMAKPKTFLDQLQQATGIAANMAGMAGAKRGSAIGYADGGDVDGPVDSSVLQSILRQLSGVDQEKFLDEIQGHDTPIEETPPMGLAARGAGAPGPAPDVSGLGGGFREKIMKGEGTDKFSSPYDVVYGANPRTGLSPYANPRDHLSSMPMGDVQDFQHQLIGATRGKVRGLGPDVGTGAVGAYQFTRDTLANIAQKLYGPDWKSIPFSPKVQDELASELASERHGHLAGTWAAFRDQGPEGRLLRAQAGYAFGGVAGRNGYDDGGSIKTDENGYLVDPSAEPSSEGFGDEGYTPSGTMGEKEMSSSPYGDRLIDSAMSQIRSVAPNEEGYSSMEQMGSQAESNLAERAPSEKDRLSDLRGEPRDRGVLGNVLHGKFISGLGKGEADSWLPLLAGIGASMSGPYRGIVGLGQGLAAGAKTAQGIRQYELGSELGRGQLGVAQQQAATNRLHVLVDAVPQFMSRFKDAGNGYFYDPTGHFSGNGPVGANGKKMLSAAEMDSLRGNFIDQIARNYNMDPDQISSAAGLNAAGGLGGSGPAAPVAPTPSGGAPEAVNPAGTPTVTRHRPVRAAATPASPQDWRNPQNYATSAEYTPMPAKTPGAVYTMETDPDALQRRANAGDPTAQNLLAQYRAGRFAPIVAATQRPDDAYTRWASGLTTQKANVETDRNSAVAFRNGASNYKTERDAIVAPTDQVLQAGKAQDVGYGGRGLTYQISHGLLPYGLVGGETAKITNDAEAARAMAQGAANLAHKYGIPFTAPNIAFGGNTSGALYYGIMMERAAANAAHHKADTFYHHDTALSGAGGLGQMSKFNRDWAANNPITSFLGQDVSRNGFIKGMTNQEKAQYVGFLPSVPRTGTPRDGLYQFKGGLVEYHNGQAYPGGMPGSRLIAN